MATIPKRPDLIDMPFAEHGHRLQVPTNTDLRGRASQYNGFPEECSLPLDNNGIAPSRMDFNGIFHMITQWQHWAQSGGQAIYDETLNYVTPALVYKDNTIYFCYKDNGPDVVGVGVKIPSTQAGSEYWYPILGRPSVDTFGTDANNYTQQGKYQLTKENALTNFPPTSTPSQGKAGFLYVEIGAGGKNCRQHYIYTEDNRHQYVRVCTDISKPADERVWTQWRKILTEADVRGDAYCQRYITLAQPDNAIGQDNDLWIVWRA